jgi:hypothetical protein
MFPSECHGYLQLLASKESILASASAHKRQSAALSGAGWQGKLAAEPQIQKEFAANHQNLKRDSVNIRGQNIRFFRKIRGQFFSGSAFIYNICGNGFGDH